MSVRTFDVVVVGAGIAGAAAAQRAVELGLTTAVVEAGRPGRATTAGAGIISDYGLEDGQLHRAWLDLVRSSTAEYAALMARLGDGAERRARYGVVGEVVLATTDGERQELDRFRHELDALPLGEGRPDVQRVTGGDLRAQWPAIRRDLEGVSISSTARVDGSSLADLLLERARTGGAAWFQGAARLQPGRRVTVHVGDDVLSGGTVVVAAGVWSPQLLAPLGVPLAVTPDRGQILHLAGGPEAADAPVLKTFGGPYLLGFPGPRIVIGATHEVGGTPTPEVRAGDQLAVLQHAFAVAPGLAAHRILETRVGFRPASPDGLPLIGPVADGVSVLNGLGSWGLTLGPMLGRRLVDGLLDVDDAQQPDLGFLSPMRPDAVPASIR
ncbi:FAD-dependent oxidoreductase [Amnibacterium sp. CER49]|uniref:NAD(P)/FAD-dependent oxidoreductase n=1 Tax=Amnibacterium sp. CER49 TaxID=3039161 RepID=UPI00244C1C78|nr:FAD-dependent oxidoreductase [Amnibacterium sp. CER49]MDH2442613.1 FAD-dependent oxidoreductase [Amnibacterium sp. CER49]